MQAAHTPKVKGNMPFNFKLQFYFLIISALFSFSKPAQVTAQETRSTRAAYEAGDPYIEQAFLKGMRNLEGGNPEQAVEQFLLILADDPTLVRVRLELARAYFLSQQWARARNEFFKVLSSDLPDPVRATVLDFIRAIDARRGFDWDLSVGLISLGNSRNYNSDQVDLNVGGAILPFQLNRDNSSEIGLGLQGTASYRKPLPGQVLGMQAVSFASASLDIKEGRASRYDDYQLTGRLGLRFLTQRTTASIAPIVSTRFIAGNLYESRSGFEAALERRGLLGGSAFGFLSSNKLHNQISEDLDGYETYGEVGFRKSFSGRDIVGLSFYLNDKNVDNGFENHLKRGLRVFGSFTIKNGLTLSPSIYYAEKNYRNPSQLFIGNTDEKSYGAKLRIEKSDFFIGNGFTPFAEMEYSKTKSGIDAYSYTESRIEAGLDRRF